MTGSDPRRHRFILAILSAALFVALLCGVCIGPVSISISDALGIVWKRLPGLSLENLESKEETIVMVARLPRLALGLLVGYSLSLCGVIMQGVFRNPLAEPYFLGIASGGTAGAALVIACGLDETGIAVPLGAFGGGLIAVSFVYRISLSALGKISEYSLILSGVAIACLFGSVTSFLIYIADPEDLQRIVFFLLGSLGGESASFAGYTLPALLVVVCIGATMAQLVARDLNALMLGDDMATHLGVDSQSLKKILLLVATLLTTTVVALAGIIGFVGLIIPHGMRLLLGPDHRLLLPASGLAGATFLIVCDTAARSVIPGADLPVGIVTSVVGAPFLIYLLRRPRSQSLRRMEERSGR